jgi:hypothetical protein
MVFEFAKDVQVPVFQKVLAWFKSRNPVRLPKDLRGLRNTLRAQCVVKVQLDHTLLFTHLQSIDVIRLADRKVALGSAWTGIAHRIQTEDPLDQALYDQALQFYDQALQKALHWIQTSASAGCLPHRPASVLSTLRGFCDVKICLEPDAIIHELLRQGLIGFKGEDYACSDGRTKRRRIVDKDPGERGIMYHPTLSSL